MNSEIHFEPIKWDSRGIVLQTNVEPIVTGNSRLVRAIQRRNTKPVRLGFRFDRELNVSGESLALALSTLCGKSYDRIKFDFEVPESITDDISRWTESVVETLGDADKSAKSLEGTVLNFSGGFDSLAAHFLLPADHDLVSLGFGGRFGREKYFYRQFDPIQIDTNLVNTSLRQNSWSFIGLGALLTMNATQSKYCTFGSIIESTGLKRNTAHEKGFTFPPFASAGMTNAPATQGISEVGTALVIAEYAPELLAPSLTSLASPGEEKLFRKWALATTGLLHAGREVSIPRVERPESPHYCFGDRFVIDLSAMTIASLGHEELAKQLVKGLDDKRIKDSRAMNFEFMFKADDRMYKNYPIELKEPLEASLKKSGIDWYTQEDRDAAKHFREYWESTPKTQN
ncbi:hypothetical protein [Corynebacterium casei]|uniref:hypothetical protein n=1 Tax=Corynebacterium casei TaxID=160386 RepID=UPI003F9B4B5D